MDRADIRTTPSSHVQNVINVGRFALNLNLVAHLAKLHLLTEGEFVSIHLPQLFINDKLSCDL
ncbi:hypothetical protein PsorP6_018566 [Peronosclerospora sorghi]|nr:hypothetical protein PsorP6_018566 [Peronosclerospora sorghi]